MDGLASEVHDFEKEMEAFIAESAHLDQFVETLGQNEEKVAMTKVWCLVFIFMCHA